MTHEYHQLLRVSYVFVLLMAVLAPRGLAQKQACPALPAHEGVSVQCISFEGHEYLVAQARLTSNVRIAVSGGKGRLALQDFKAPDGFHAVVVANAGIFGTNEKALGLFVEHGHQISPLDLKDCLCSQPGNFYWKPNGVFWIDSKNRPHITDSEEFSKEFSKTHTKDIREATQSGPLLLQHGVTHPDPATGKPTSGFLKSASTNIRNAVGIGPGNEVFLVMSLDATRMVDLARFFRDRLKCVDALYLDGAISDVYLPELRRSVVQQDGGTAKLFVTLIGFVIAAEKQR